jgi:hypothetical protein
MTSRTYIWQTERPRDQQVFLATVCKIYRKYTQGRLPSLLNLNFQIDEVPTESISPPPVHAQPTLYNGGAPSASQSSLAAPPALRSRQGSHSSIASSQMTGQESHYTAPSTRQRPSVDSRRAEGSFSSQNRPMDVGHREGPYAASASPIYGPGGQPVQQYTPVPGMGRQMSEPYEPSPLQGTTRRDYDYDDAHSRSQPRNIHVPYNEHQGMSMSISPTRVMPHFPPSGSNQGSYPNASSPLAERPSGLASRNVSEARTPTQATYGFREQAIPPPATLQIPPVQQSQPPPTPAQAGQSSEVPVEDGYASDAMLTPVPAASNGFEQALTPPALPRRNIDAPVRSEEKKRAMLPPIITNASGSSAAPRSAIAVEREQAKREAETSREQEKTPVVKEVKHVQLPPPPPPPEIDEEADREPQPRARRASFVAPPTTTPYSRDMLLRAGAGSFAQAEALLEQDDADGEEMEDATMANVEEILEGFDWGNHAVESSGSYRAGAEAIEARLLDELNALEAVSSKERLSS